MLEKNLIFLIIIPCLIFASAAPAQRKAVQRSKTVKNRAAAKKPARRQTPKKIISGGVMNGKALYLARPEYPLSARQFRVHGSVSIEVLIDENGQVVKARALRGHPFFTQAALKAARESKFVPLINTENVPFKVSGVIIYNFVAHEFNWLQIGFWLLNPFYQVSERPENFLPAGFELEKQLLREAKPEPREQYNQIIETAGVAIEGKLLSENKNLWLFQVGKELGKLSNLYWNDQTETLKKLEQLVPNAPDDVSPALIVNLESLLSTARSEPEKFNDRLTRLIERLYAVGR